MKLLTKSIRPILAFLVSTSVWAQSPPRPKDGFRTDGSATDLQSTVSEWKECNEFLSKAPCKVTINMSNKTRSLPRKENDPPNAPIELIPHAHTDIQIDPVFVPKNHQDISSPGQAVIVLDHSSPFLSCTVTTTPAAIGRDLSANVGTLLTSIGSQGAPTHNFNAAVVYRSLHLSSPVPDHFSKLSEGGMRASEMMNHEASATEQLNLISNSINATNKLATDRLTQVINGANGFSNALKIDWKYTFASQQEFDYRARHLQAQIIEALDSSSAFEKENLSAHITTYEQEMAKFKTDFLPKNAFLKSRFEEVQHQLDVLEGDIEVMKATIADLAPRRALMIQVKGILVDAEDQQLNPDPTIQVLPMAYFASKSVTESIACKDRLTTNPAFDNVTFTAYYERTPRFDISTGAIVSLLGGRQIATIAQPLTPMQQASCFGSTPACMANVELGYKSQSSHQFMPGVFGEVRLVNHQCLWAVNGAHWHPAGFVCSFGLAGGIAINPNNGGTAAEFFEGISLGVQRFAFMIGAHNGRYQQYGASYYAGETFPSGTSIAPPTDTRWSTRPAFAIAYRIPLR